MLRLFNFRGKDRQEFFVNATVILVFWIIITFPAHPFTRLGIKNIIEHLFLGCLLALLVAYIYPYPILTKEEIQIYLQPKIVFKFIFYVLRLSLDIIMAGIDVAKRVLRPKLLISPGIVEIETPLSDEIQISLNANSITLTPGTITIDAEKTKDGSRFLVHCISQQAVSEIIQNKGFVKRIQECFGNKGG